VSQTFILSDWISQRQSRVEQALTHRLPNNSNLEKHTSKRLAEAMCYSTLNGGKRLRALLVYASGEALGAQNDQLDSPATAVEMIHAYSLVHDDMPIMDNDDLRRGLPTCHKAYDDATALLVGDALQSLAFKTLCDNDLTPYQQSQMVVTLAEQSGVFGMAGGQAIDLESVGETLTIENLQSMHELKTGALIRASVRLGAIASPQCDTATLEKLDQYAHAIGLAFQVQDDVLDVTADTDTLGKMQGADIALNKPTYPALLGLEKAQKKANDLIAFALQQLDGLPYETQTLAELAQFVIKRKN